MLVDGNRSLETVIGPIFQLEFLIIHLVIVLSLCASMIKVMGRVRVWRSSDRVMRAMEDDWSIGSAG